MSNQWYDKLRTRVGRALLDLNNLVDPRIIAVATNEYVFDQDHEFLSDVLAPARFAVEPLTNVVFGGGLITAIDADSVFNINLWTGDGSGQAINNGFDLTTKDAIVWIAPRNNSDPRPIFDTLRGATKSFTADNQFAEETFADSLTAFTATGYSLGASTNLHARTNVNTSTYAGFTFVKDQKFLDIVEFTGDGTALQTVTIDLENPPGFIIVADLDSGSISAPIFHRSLGKDKFMELDTNTLSATNTEVWGDTDPIATAFYTSVSAISNVNLTRYVAYCFAHDASPGGVIQCGSFIGTGAIGNGITLGWKPQFLIIKRAGAGSAANWWWLDTTRGILSPGNDQGILMDAAASENAGERLDLSATGFSMETTSTALNANAIEYIYIAIREGGSGGGGGGVTDGWLDADDPTFALPGVDTVDQFIIYEDTGVDATSPLLLFIDEANLIPKTTETGKDLEVVWQGLGIAKL